MTNHDIVKQCHNVKRPHHVCCTSYDDGLHYCKGVVNIKIAEGMKIYCFKDNTFHWYVYVVYSRLSEHKAVLLPLVTKHVRASK